MKKYKSAILGAALTVASMGISQASIVSGTAVLGSTPTGISTMTVAYTVDEITPGNYQYEYVLTTTPGEGISAFNLAILDPIALSSVTGMYSSAPLFGGTAFISGPTLVWDFAGGTTGLPTSATVGFDSPYLYTFGNAGATDSGAVSWNSPATVPVPVSASVPEPSTVVAGALLLLPFGVSTLRILRKKQIS